MDTSPASITRARLPLVGLLVLALGVLALPVMAADPSGPPSEPPATRETPPRDKPDHAGKKAKEPKVAVTVRGTVSVSQDEDGHPVYELTADGKTWQLDAGPPWFHGDAHPLKSHVGKTVTIAGEAGEGSSELDVETIDGTALRSNGPPPWAGGWKAVGERHPGWSADKAARHAERSGDCFPPGQCRNGKSAED